MPTPEQFQQAYLQQFAQQAYQMQLLNAQQLQNFNFSNLQFQQPLGLQPLQFFQAQELPSSQANEMLLTIFDIVFQQWLPTANQATISGMLICVGYLCCFLTQAKLIALNENLMDLFMNQLKKESEKLQVSPAVGWARANPGFRNRSYIKSYAYR